MATKRPSMRDRIREQAQQSTTEGASYLKIAKKVHFFAPKAEEYELDVIPYENTLEKHPKGYEVGELIPFLRFKLHAGIGAEDKRYVCPTSIGKKCPICDERSRMAKSSNGDADLIKALTPKERTLFQVIDLKDEKKGIQIMDISYHMFAKKLLGDIDKSENTTSTRRRSTAHAGFAELEGGQTLIATFIEKKMGSNKFYECDRIDAEDRDDYGEEILDEVLNLDECLKVLDYDTLEAIFLELDPEDQGNGRTREDKKEKEETPKRGRKSAEEDDEPAPTRSRGRKEEPADEPPPTRKRGKVEESVDEEPVTTTRRRGAKVEETAEETTSSRRGAKADPEDEPVTTTRRRGAKVEEPEDEPEVVEEPVASSRRGRTAAKEESAPKGDCYVPGGVFGKDCDTHTAEAPEPNCYDCPEATWKKCKEAQMAMNK